MGEDCQTSHDIEITCRNGRLEGKWETEGGGEHIQGSVSARAAQIKYKAKSEGLLSRVYWGDPEDGFAFLSQDGSSLHVQLVKKKKVRFFILTRIADSESLPLQSGPTTA